MAALRTQWSRRAESDDIDATDAVRKQKTDPILRTRTIVKANSLMIIGIIIGSAPTILYILQYLAGTRGLDPLGPMGIRPPWQAGDAMVFLIRGLPILFGADARPFLCLATIGRDPTIQPLDLITSGLAAGADWLVLGSLTTMALIFLITHRHRLSALFRLRSANHPPAMLLVLGLCSTISLYLLGTGSFDFMSIRYLVPLWAFVPGIIAAVFVSRRFRLAARLAPICACAAWTVGQYTMSRQLGNPHPLRPLANTLVERHTDTAIAGMLDAHLLSYLTGQRCRVIEYEPFWPRLSHYRTLLPPDTAAIRYVVNVRDTDRSNDWIADGWPGEAPPQTRRVLWPRLRQAAIDDPTLVLDRQPLVAGYERIRLRKPLLEQQRMTSEPIHRQNDPESPSPRTERSQTCPTQAQQNAESGVHLGGG